MKKLQFVVLTLVTILVTACGSEVKGTPVPTEPLIGSRITETTQPTTTEATTTPSGDSTTSGEVKIIFLDGGEVVCRLGWPHGRILNDSPVVAYPCDMAVDHKKIESITLNGQTLVCQGDIIPMDPLSNCVIG